MPSLITHELFGKEVCRALPQKLSTIIQANIEEFSIGTSGPDLFFYYNAWPWLNQNEAKKIAKIGNEIHSHHIHEFFKDVFETVKDHQSQEKISYVAGLLCHWALDKEAHPYIFNQTESDKGGDSSLYHRRFESHLDYLMLQLIRGQSGKDYPGYKLLKYDSDTVKAIYEIYSEPVKHVYGYTIDSKCIETCLKHFYNIQKVLFDPHGYRKKFLYQVESKVLHKPYIFTSMIMPMDIDKLDILNQEKRNWHHPCTNKPSNKSFVELFNQAILLGQEVCAEFFNYLKGDTELDTLLAIINNQSFETGLSVLSPMKYYDCIYER